MQNYKMVVSYDGTNFRGWQSQKNTSETVQGKIEEVLARFAGCEVEVNGAGRTDAGVHANAQVANFKLPIKRPPIEIRSYLNRYLPESVFVRSVEFADDRFHARLTAKGKTYCYRIFPENCRDPFIRKYAYLYDRQLDVDKMRKAGSMLEGTHDFRGFCTKPPKDKSTERTIYSFDINKNDETGLLEIRFTGDGFMYNQVRIMVGTLLEIGIGEKKPEIITEILAAGDRQLAGFTAPPTGLSLERVFYE